MGTNRNRDPVARPPLLNRRRLLLAFGLGAANVAVLRHVGGPGDRSPTTFGGSTPSMRRPDGDVPDSVRPGDPSPSGPTLEQGDRPPLPTDLPGTPTPSPPEPGHVFDVVIRGGRVLDPESGFDAIVDIGIDGAVIAALSYRPLIGADVIDATGLVVAPGFVDLLSYEPNPFGAWLKLADGVTTNLAMHGVSNYAAPFFQRFDGESPVHFGGAFHQHFMRGFDLGLEIDDEADRFELAEFETLARRGLADGFAGISFSPEYSPGTSRSELRILAEVAAELGHVTFFHVRFSDPDPPGTSLEAIDEVLAVVDETGASAHIEHLTSTGGTFVMTEALDRIEQARDGGHDVTACLYPYDYWATFLGSQRFAAGWRTRYRLSESDLQVAGTATRLSPSTIADARRSNKLVAALGSIPEAEIEEALARPWTIVASDAILSAERNNHPRGAGTFSRLIGRYVRQRGVLSLMDAVAKVTILPARRVEGMIPAMTKKGRVRPGADADLVIFDPESIADRATVAEPATPSVGIEWVLVDGRVALRNGVVDRSVLAGRPLRSAVL